MPAAAEEEFDWDQRLAYPAYIYHVTFTSTYSVNREDDRYLWHRNTPDDNGVVHDSLGHYRSTTVAGPLHTPREMCNAQKRLDQNKDGGSWVPYEWAGVQFNCSALEGGGAAPGSSESSSGGGIKSAATNAVKGAAPGAAVVALVNGVRVFSTILGPIRSNGRRRRKRKYTLDIKVQDGQGTQRMSLAADDEDFLWIYAQVRCDDPKANPSLTTRTLAFLKEEPNSDWLVLGPPRFVGGYKVVAVKAKEPYPDAALNSEEATVAVTANIEGQQIRGPVKISLDLYEVVFVETHDRSLDELTPA
jgi:hypothetical protein